ncbi:NTP transferase domain-containing protein [Maribacter sp. PR1]|uniref:Probable molybdenum cofactor guanylyltransferase n=1 Tax=Maribacter cobaltidurans TaxID=1178778 RepID=A0ABU7IW92_9FLAO|nr:MULTISPECIES: NTP transferase domain-containing protein [Maribacter]MDC6389857.1 NTP transferase domain-containing protein [Maribacter sp. PR1]MEE1977247.1 NTP transferase domain-containing protein [Maribacter cobaltidurans]
MTSKDRIYGLVLSGGKSTRMGQDKGLIPYHGIPQREYLYHLLSKVCDEAFLSIRSDQQNSIAPDFNVIVDKDEFRGPYNGLLSAHKKYSEVSWLVLACDLPLINEEALKELIGKRNSKKMATAFANEENPLPEPLAAIWEPEALKISISYLKAGNGTCPRKFLIHNDVSLVFPEKQEVLLNANSQLEYQEALQKLEV